MYQLGDDPAFERCLPDTLKEEAPDPSNLRNPRNYSDDVHDRGRGTMDGITQQSYDRWQIEEGQPTGSVRFITPEVTRTIYYRWYWLPHCPAVPAGLDLCMFDTNVNNGVHYGTLLLQRALRITADGIFGPETEQAIAALKGDARDLQLAITRFYAARRAYYLSLEDARYFGKDWLRRDLDIETWALAMAQRAAA